MLKNGSLRSHLHYDNAGNIIEKKKYALRCRNVGTTTDAISYGLVWIVGYSGPNGRKRHARGRIYIRCMGKLISTSGTLASTLGADNPFRYRGYYYDAETGLYYLMTRYYDPEVGRFLSADVYLSTGQGVLGNNRFAYCNNDPILFYDSDGTSPITPILNLIDFSAIHKMVQISILKELGGTAKMEVYVKTDNGRIGFLDIYDLSNNWYYEVKSKGASQRATTERQMARYESSKVVSTGKRPKPGTSNAFWELFIWAMGCRI